MVRKCFTLHFSASPHMLWGGSSASACLLPACPTPPLPGALEPAEVGRGPGVPPHCEERQAGWGPRARARSRQGSVGEPQGMGCLVGQWVMLLSRGWGSVVARSVPGSRVRLKVREGGFHTHCDQRKLRQLNHLVLTTSQFSQTAKSRVRRWRCRPASNVRLILREQAAGD